MSHAPRNPRMRMNKTVTGPERNMVLRVLKFFVDEKYDPESSIPISKVLKRTSVATGVSISTIKRIRSEAQTIINSLGTPDEESEIPLPTPGGKRRKRKDKLEYSPKIIKGLRTIINAYQRAHSKMMPLKDIFEVAKQNLNFPGQMETLRKLLVDELGYSFNNDQTNPPRQYKNRKIAPCHREPDDDVKPQLSSIFLETTLKVEVDDFNEVNSGNIKTEVVEMEKTEPESILCEIDIKGEGFS